MRATVASVGACCSLGMTWEETWAGLLNGAKTSSDFRTLYCDLDLPMSVSAVSGLKRGVEPVDPAIGAASRLAKYAIADALSGNSVCGRLSVFGGSTHGESDVLVDVLRRLDSGKQVRPELWRGLVEDSLARNCLAESVGGAWVNSACTSSMHALTLAVLEIADAHAVSDRAIALGVDAISALGTTGFRRIGAASKSTCRPFATDRDGTLVGEGAATLLLSPVSVEEDDQSSAKLLGLGLSCEAGHATRPSDEGASLAKAIRSALRVASIEPDDIVALVLHGTGTDSNDENEVKAIQSVFGVNCPPATSIKGAIGHTMGAAGIFNCLVAVQACVDAVLPPTVLGTSQSLPGIDVVRDAPRPIGHGPVLVTCSGFGGNNAAAVFARA